VPCAYRDGQNENVTRAAVLYWGLIGCRGVRGAFASRPIVRPGSCTDGGHIGHGLLLG
jgi:hypothetical protein